MTAIDLIVLGMLKDRAMSAYDIQKLVEYRNISKWVRISTPSIYKKVIQLEAKGLIEGSVVKEGKMPEKAVYSLTKEGENAFESLMLEMSRKPVRFYLDLNAVIVNLDHMEPECRRRCLENIEKSVSEMKAYLEDNLNRKEALPDIPPTGMAVLRQQLILAEAIEAWLASLRPFCPISPR